MIQIECKNNKTGASDTKKQSEYVKTKYES